MVWFATQKARAEKFIYHYAHYLPTVAFVWGLFWDSLTLRRPDTPFENATAIGYLLFAAGVIILLSMRQRRADLDPSLLLLGLLQFAFGNLSSALLVLYIKSGTFVGSILFFAALGVVLVGNEFIRDRYSRLHINIGVWYFLLLSYLMIVVPILWGTIGDIMFGASVLLSVGITALLLLALYAVSAKALLERLFHIGLSVCAIALLMCALYFSGNIPPAPLMLKQIGIYHSVARSAGGSYLVTYEAPVWYDFLHDTSPAYTLVQNGSAYCASAVFAPAHLSTPIYHRWERYDEVEQKWITILRIPFGISGGRVEGYRGYSQTTALSVGKWRCDVETERGALIGRFNFTATSGMSAQLAEGTF